MSVTTVGFSKFFSQPLYGHRSFSSEPCEKRRIAVFTFRKLGVLNLIKFANA